MTEPRASAAPPRRAPLSRHALDPIRWSWALVALGVAVRLVGFLSNRYLRFEEAAVALNLTQRAGGAILEPLEHMQAAPIGFLLIEEAAIALLGPSEQAMRVYPLAASILALILFRSVALRILSPAAALAAIALVACSSYAIFFASDIKQYSGDLLATAVMLQAVTRLDTASPSARSLAVLGLAGLLLVPLSHPVCFVLAAIGGALFWEAIRRRARPAMLQIVGISAAWLLMFLYTYSISLAMADVSGLMAFWENDFMPFPPSSWDDVAWLAKYPVLMFRTPAGLSPAEVAALVFALGCYGTWRAKRFWLMVCAVPMVLALFASALELYPFYDRFLLFAVPLLSVILAEGILEAWRQLQRVPTPAIRMALHSTLLVALFWGPFQSACLGLIDPEVKDIDVRALVTAFADHLDGREIVYVRGMGSIEARLLYYQPRMGLSDADLEYRDLPSPEDLRSEGLGDADRAWFVFPFNPPRRTSLYTWRPGVDAKAAMAYAGEYREALDRIGTRLESVEASGIRAYLYRIPAPGAGSEQRE